MFLANNRGFFPVFIIVFILMAIIGGLAGVSLKASLIRAFLAALFFMVLSWIVVKGVVSYVLQAEPDETAEDLPDDVLPESDMGKHLDFTVSDSRSESSNETTDFSPISAKQIDPNVEKVINSDPVRMAEMVKKMGFEE